MSISLWGAVSADDVAPVTADGDALLAAASSYARAVVELSGQVTTAAGAWASLPGVLDADALTPALQPLIAPAVRLGTELLDSAGQLARAATTAQDRIAALKTQRSALVADIESFRAPAPARAEAHVARQAAAGDVLGAVVTAVSSWGEVPELAEGELTLKWRVQSFNDTLSSTLSSLAAQLNAIESGAVGGVRLPEITGPRASVSLLDGGVAPEVVAALTGGSVAGLFADLSPEEIRKALAKNDALDDWVKGLSAKDAAAWWASLGSEQRAAVIAAAPIAIGALDGIPALDRVAANKKNAAATLAADRKNVAAWQRSLDLLPPPPVWASSVEQLLERDELTKKLKAARSEIGYLKTATGDDPTVQLYLFDPKNSRIIQMIGTPTPRTTHVISYVPGTFTSMQSFYGKQTQAVANYLVGKHADDTVAFVYKDGPFPGGNDETGASKLLRINEANDVTTTLADGARLAAFEKGLGAGDPELANAKSVGMGHSWGLADVTSSEVAGARHDQVISLSGAGMTPQWHPRTGTSYTDFSYYDLLQQAQRLPGHPVWNGEVPRASAAFQHGPYYVNPGQTVFSPDDGRLIAYETQLMDDHNLIASVSPANQVALAGITKQVFQ